jgi:DNA-binding CsgD family transcriptional regulator
MRGRKRIERPEITELVNAGFTGSVIAARLGMAAHNVYSYLRSRGLSKKTRGRASRFDVNAINEMAKQGMTHYDAAAALNANWRTIYYLAKRHGIVLAQRTRGRKATTASAPTVARAERMAEMFRNGCTLQAIGDEFKITRERVRQIIKKHHSLTGKNGGRAIISSVNRDKAARKRSIRYQQKYGCTIEEWRQLRDLGFEMVSHGVGIYRTPLRAYLNQKYNAKRRGIGWDISLWDWWQVWQRSGKWGQRGRGQGYVMCRRGDEGPYAVGNVFIAPAADNSSRRKGKKSGLPTGVHQRKGRFIVRRHIDGISYHIGTFATVEEASSAYLTFDPIKRRAA